MTGNYLSVGEGEGGGGGKEEECGEIFFATTEFLREPP